MTKILRTIIKIMIIFLIILLVMEVSLRFINIIPLSPLKISNRLLWEYKPEYHANVNNNHYQINSYGLRNPEITLTRDNNTTRILILGDSFIEAAQVSPNETFTNQLEKILNKNSNRFETINAGVSMYGTDQEIGLLLDKGINLKPTHVVLSFFVGNDISDNYDRMLFLVNENKIIRNTKPPFPFESKIKIFLASTSSIYCHVRHIQNYLNYAFSKNTRELYFDNSMDVFLIDNPFNSTWNKTTVMINYTRNILKEKNISFCILLIPDKKQVDKELYHKGIAKFNITKDKIDITIPQRKIIEYAEENNICYIDLLPEFIEKNKNNSFYLNTDSHWNIEGNKYAAEITYKKILNDNFIQQ